MSENEDEYHEVYSLKYTYIRGHINGQTETTCMSLKPKEFNTKSTLKRPIVL